MEDTGEDVLRQKPSVVATFFKRIGQVNKCLNYHSADQKSLKIDEFWIFFEKNIKRRL